MDWLEVIREISILIGVWVAIYGIDSWRREHTGRRQYELAEETLAMFYEARDAVRHMRHPMTSTGETEDVKLGEGETEKAWEARKNASVVFKRYNTHQELFGKLWAMRYRFMVQFGQEKAKPFNDLQGIVNEVMISARMLARLWARDSFHSEERWNRHLDSVEKCEAIFWEGVDDEDPINPKLDKVIEEIEKTCSTIIKGKGTIYGFLNRPLT